ncbi:MAG: ATP-binding protein, partial [Candidatus Omnitrophica bacterium]|nr:ATP-binding protein [Candidatus Omnitrophota bacterium]
TVIATGHTLDDQAETILIRLIKGASLKGMAGIAPVRDEVACRIIRPIIELEKGEVKRYLDKANIPYRIDRTNEEPIYFRNIVRSEIIPFLERYNPRLKRVLSNLAGHLREDFEFIAKEKSRAMKGMKSSIQGGAVGLELKTIVVQPRALQKEILRDLLERSGGTVKKLSFRHWKELENLIKLKKKGKSVDLPGGIRAERTSSEIVFRKIILP